MTDKNETAPKEEELPEDQLHEVAHNLAEDIRVLEKEIRAKADVKNEKNKSLRAIEGKLITIQRKKRLKGT